MVFTELNNFVLLEVAQNLLSATGTRAVTLETSAQSIILVSNLGVTIGLAFLVLAHLAYSILFVSSKALPRPLGWLGVVASVIGIVGALLGLVITDLLFILTGGIIIVMLYEIVLGIWLLR